MNCMDDQSEGLTLLDALERYSEPEAWREYRGFEPYHRKFGMDFIGRPTDPAESMRRRAVSLRKELERDLLERLRNGDLIADALAKPLRPDSVRIRIGGNTWNLVTVDFDDSAASGHGLEIFDIRIHEPNKHKANRGRKTDRFTQNEKIHASFLKMIQQEAVSYVRGGLSAAARELKLQFPEYQEDSIRRIIQPVFKEHASKTRQKRK